MGHDIGARMSTTFIAGRCGLRGRRGFGDHHCDPSGHGFSNQHVQVGRIRCMRCRFPTVVVAYAANVGSMRAVCAGERRKPAESG
eukprot:1844948-Pleurochrysis_carterae.AAC.1